ncbi:MAG: transposase [Paludibacteraceae bacterium]
MLSITNNLRLNNQQYEALKMLSRASKNLYNLGLYNTRQYFFQNSKFLKYPENYHLCKENENYKMMQAATSQQSLKYVEREMRSFFGLLKLYRNGQLHKPNMPHYQDKEGYFMLAFPKNAFSIKNGKVRLGVSKEFMKKYPKDLLTFNIPKCLNKFCIHEIHVLPQYNGKYFKIKYCYEEKTVKADLDYSKYLSIDLGVSNFATFVDTDGTASIIDGKYVKSLNQWYNKENARLQSIKDMQGIKKITTRQIKLLTKRSNKITEFMNRSVNYLVNHCLKNNIGNILIGELTGIKQGINHGKTNNQNFVQIPFGKFKAKLESKCNYYGIKYQLVDEAYTSQVDSLALDPVEKPDYGKSRRVKRGLYKSSTGQLINADINGAINILRKVVSDSLVKGIIDSGLVNRPIRLRLAYESNC